MSFRPSIASAVSVTSPQTITGTGPGSGGPLHTLGARTWLDGQQTDQTLMWLTAAGVIAGGPTYGPHAAATDLEVILYANSGPMELVYVHNATGAVIQRGTVVTWDTGAVFATGAAVGDVVAGSGATVPVGVTLSDIPIDHCFWAARSGIVPVLLVGASADGALLQAAAAGNLDDGGATTSNMVGITADALAVGAGVWLARLLFP